MAVHIDKSTIYSTNGKQIWGKTLESMEWCLVRNKIKHWNKYKIGKSPTHVGKIFPFPPPLDSIYLVMSAPIISRKINVEQVQIFWKQKGGISTQALVSGKKNT